MAQLNSTLRLTLHDNVTKRARGISALMNRLSGQARAMNRVGRGAGFGRLAGQVGALAGAYIGLREGISNTIGAAMSFENAMGDIRKVVDFKTPKQFEELRAGILDMSRRLPVSADGIAAIVAAAGQANVPTEELERFAEMTAKVSTAWDIGAGTTGESLAKMKTALGLTVAETGLLADAINHLSNNTASSAPNLLRFSRGLAVGVQAGFDPTQVLAFGSAMIGSGFEAEVAETSFRNMTRALTAGASATKTQRVALRKMGFDTKRLARRMQEDAVGTTMEVFRAINKLPKDEQGAIINSVFGAEARALPAILNNMDEIVRTLGLVAEKSEYAGSATEEFEVAAQRTSASLKRLGNNVRAIGIGIGDRVLPSINAFASELSDAIYGDPGRVSIFDRIGAAYDGFLKGIGGGGDDPFKPFRKHVDDLRNFIFGKPITPDLMPWEIRDRQRNNDKTLAGITSRFRELGSSLSMIVDGNVLGGLNKLTDGLTGLTAVSGTLGTAAGLLSLSLGLKALGVALRMGFMLWGPFRLLAMAYGISQLIIAVKDVGSLGEFVDLLKGLEAVDWLKIAAGIAFVIGPLRTLRGLFGLGKGLGKLAGRTVRGGRTSSPGAPEKAGRTPKVSSTTRAEPAPKAPGGKPGKIGPGLLGLRYLADPRVLAALAATGGLFAGLANAQPGPDLLAEQRKRVRELLSKLRMAGSDQKDFTFGSTSSGFVPAGRAPDRRDGFVRAPLAVRRSNAATGELPSSNFEGFEALKAFLQSMAAGPQQVIGGPVTTQPSGVQDVNMTNPPPRPNINVSLGTVNVNTGEDYETVRRKLGDAVVSAAAAAYSDGGF